MSDFWLSVGLLLIPLIAVLAEWGIGLPGHWHPLSYYRQLGQILAKRVNRAENGPAQQRQAGALALLILVGLPIAAYWGLSVLADAPLLLDGVLLFFLLSWRPIIHDLTQVMDKMSQQQTASARLQLSNWTLRDTHQLSQNGIGQATGEALILNLAHGWFAVLFWYALLGPAGALAYRLIDLLHQCWNRKYPEFNQFGRPVDSFHRILCWLPDQLLAWLMCIFGNMRQNIAYKNQGFRWIRASSGQLIGITASWMNAELGGQRFYQGMTASYPLFGPKHKPPLAHDFRILRFRCFLTGLNYLIFIIYPILLCRYLIIG